MNASEEHSISVGITCFNAEDTIERALKSALEQTRCAKEILVVDDGSNDGSVRIINRLAAEHELVRLYRHETNRGYAAALNTLVRNAQGEYIAFFDDDDASVPDRLGEQLGRLGEYEVAHPGVPVLCYTNRNVVRVGGVMPDHMAKCIGRCPPEPRGLDVVRFLLWDLGAPGYVWGMFGSCTLMARRRTLEAVGGFDEEFRRCAEWDMAVRAGFGGAHFIGVNKALVTQYKTATADKVGDVSLRYSLKLRRKYREYLVEERVYWVACVMAYARFHSGKGRRWRARMYLALACGLAPIRFFAAKVLARMRAKAVEMPVA